MSGGVALRVLTDGGVRTIHVPPDLAALPLAEVLRRHDLPLNTRCGQRGLCDGCIVELIDGELVHLNSRQRIISRAEPLALRACEHAAADATALTIHLPAHSMLGHRPQVLSNFVVSVPVARLPLGDQPNRPLGIAIDVGTTTVVVLAVRREDGQVLGTASGFNRQMDLGDDVLTRINLCYADAAMVAPLRRALVVDTLAPLLSDALAQAKATPGDVACITAAGNTTMLHLLAGVNPASMGIAPFTPAFLEHRVLSGRGVGLETFTDFDPPLHLLPGAAAYIGADLVAGVFASGLVYDEGPSLLVDIGTNGEIIARYHDHLIGCATAAGPAFEGARLACGMRAAEGAITHVRVNTCPLRFDNEVLGGGRAIGLCGSAYIDLLAQLRRVGLLMPAGRFDRTGGVAEESQFLALKSGQALRVAKGLGKRDVIISEPDIATLLQAKAAIAAGILTLLDRLHLMPADVKRLYLAGGFGMHLDIPNAIACGLLPGFTPEQVTLVGNTSLAGAYLTLLDRSVLDELSTIAKRLEAVELNLEPNFESHFIDQLSVA